MNAVTKAEDWLSIQGYEGLYSISNMGRVRSEAKTVHRKARWYEGASATRLSEEFNVSRMTAFRAATGRSWSHL